MATEASIATARLRPVIGEQHSFTREQTPCVPLGLSGREHEEKATRQKRYGRNSDSGVSAPLCASRRSDSLALAVVLIAFLGWCRTRLQDQDPAGDHQVTYGSASDPSPPPSETFANFALAEHRGRTLHVAAQDRAPDADARALLGELLKQARVEGGHPTQADLSRLLGIDRTGVTRTETGGALPNWEILLEWLAQCGVSGLAEAAIIGIWKLGKVWGEPGKARTAPWFSAEAVAHTLRYWSPTVIPGLFQTATYARTLFEVMGHDAAKIDEDVNDRIKRQSILARPNPPTVICVLDEAVLDKLIGSPEIMREQCQHLLDVSQSVVIQIVPNDLGGHAGLGGSISLAATDDAPELLLSDGLVEDQVTAEPALLHRVSATFERVRAEALPRAVSRRVIKEATERWSK